MDTETQTISPEGGASESPPTPSDGAAPPSGTPGQGSAPQEPDYSLASDFLQRVDEADRAIVEKYVKQWDAGVTRRFQELHGKYQPYESLGADPETLQQAIAVMQLLDEQPQVIYNLLMEDIQKGADWAKELGQLPVQPQNAEGTPSGEQQFQGLPPEWQDRFSRNEQILEQIATIVLNEQKQAQEAAEDAALNEYLTNLKTEFGDFDEDYVLALMEQGVDGAEAVQRFHQVVQQQINQAFQAQQVPVPLSGAGAAPVESQNIAQLDKKDVRNLVAGLMSATTQQDQ